MNNPLLNIFRTPFSSIPFEDIQQEDFEPAIIESIEIAKLEIKEIVENIDTPSFENTIVALENTGKQLGVVSAAFFNICSAETNDYLEKVQESVSPVLAEFGNDITLNEDLFKRVKAVVEQVDQSKLDKEAQRLLDKTYKSFTRNGALLSEEDKTKLRIIDQELSLLTVKFSQNVLQETNQYYLQVTEESDLAGIPNSIRIQAAEEAEKRNLPGWVFTLQYPSFIPFMKYAENRELREKLYLAFGKKAFQDNEFNNEGNIKKIVQLRHERAQLLGFPTHADFVLAERMAKSPEKVYSFLEDLLSKSKKFAIQDIEQLKPLASEDEVKELMPYDHSFYSEKLRKQKFDISDESLKPYFPLNQVLDAAFSLSTKLFGITFKERTDIQKYHEEVVVYEVLENGKHKALLYTDWHPREGKRAGAWMTSYKGQFKNEDINHRPHISIVCNFSRPVGATPSLLTFMEVTTLFHEFGHALHGILADTTFESLSGTNVYWDFVELPSQFLENFCYQKEFLTSFAKHYQTGEILPESQIDRIVASANFMEGYQTLRQLSFGLLDMAYHSGQFQSGKGIAEFEKEMTKETKLYPDMEGVAQSPSFSHIFAGGYAAGYYSYKWSEVLDADAFAYFKEKGIFDPETAAKFKTLLSKGGTEDPMELFVAFRGREPQVDALLERAGLINHK